MHRTLLAVTLAAGLAAPALAADRIIVYDASLGDKFAAKRDIVDLVTDADGPAAVYDTGQELPEGFDQTIVPRTSLAADAVKEPVPAPLAGKLPHTELGTEWAMVGNHLVELTDDDRIVMVVYDVLP